MLKIEDCASKYARVVARYKENGRRAGKTDSCREKSSTTLAFKAGDWETSQVHALFKPNKYFQMNLTLYK